MEKMWVTLILSWLQSRPSQSDFLLPIRASPSLGHGPCTVAMDRLFSLSVRALEENKVCVLQKETWKQWPCPTTGWGHAQSFLLPPSPILQAFLHCENHNVVSWTGADAFCVCSFLPQRLACS